MNKDLKQTIIEALENLTGDEEPIEDRDAVIALLEDPAVYVGKWESNMDEAPKEPCLVKGQWAGEVSGIEEGERYMVAEPDCAGDHEGYEWGVESSDAYAAWVKPTAWTHIPKGTTR